MMKQSFLEKYRPEERDHVVGNNLLKERIFSLVDSGRLPNMILHGEAGIGKTSIVHVVLKEVLKEYYYSNCIVINCSDKTGVDFVRTNIIETAKSLPQGIDLRVFVLEESEQLSKSAQNALKKVFEAPFDKRNRFILLSNNLSKYIDAIKDRCRIFHFMPIKTQDMIPRLKEIVEAENIKISDKLIERLADCSNGSMRYPLIQLEEFSSLNREITDDDIKMEESLETIKNIFTLLKQKKIPVARDKIIEMYEKGNTFFDVIRHFHDFTLISLKDGNNFNMKTSVLITIAEAERSVNAGCNEFIQLSFLLSDIAQLLVGGN